MFIFCKRLSLKDIISPFHLRQRRFIIPRRDFTSGFKTFNQVQSQGGARESSAGI
jgi:hypothetical protein